ncbi:hypothetical protein CK203_061827 [Vitis vinifera]|uniref:Uncharacterized protein n=1 Tax=Vitis vinifera TaxID=29760 RepID=A0A438GIY2_VITVI|nr:hypothetical protein CK203_061827 [Vitis vinifera]
MRRRLLVRPYRSCGNPMEEMGAGNQGLPLCEPSPLALIPVKGASRETEFGAEPKVRAPRYAELEEKLKQIPPGSTTACLQQRCLKWWKRSAALETAEAEASLSTARGENKALRVDLAEAKIREESMEARLHEAEDEVALLGGGEAPPDGSFN